MTRRAMFYTEMLSSQAVIHGHSRGVLDYDAAEHPLALQVGGKNPAEMAACAELAQQWGYAEFNINAGCPGKCAQAGGFGASLMKSPASLAACVRAIRDASNLPVSVKCRIGVEGHADESKLFHFIESNVAAGCGIFIVHARTAVLGNFSPKQNRTIPPLNYERVYRLKEAFPECEIILNGGIRSLDQAQAAGASLDGVMLGRAVYNSPFMLLDVDSLFYGCNAKQPDKYGLSKAIITYVAKALAEGAPSGILLKHLLKLFNGQRHAREWRRWLSQNRVMNTDFLQQLEIRFKRMLEMSFEPSDEGKEDRVVAAL